MKLKKRNKIKFTLLSHLRHYTYIHIHTYIYMYIYMYIFENVCNVLVIFLSSLLFIYLEVEHISKYIKYNNQLLSKLKFQLMILNLCYFLLIESKIKSFFLKKKFKKNGKTRISKEIKKRALKG